MKCDNVGTIIDPSILLIVLSWSKILFIQWLPDHGLRLKYFDFSQPWLHYVDILNHLMTNAIDYCMEVNKTIFIYPV